MRSEFKRMTKVMWSQLYRWKFGITPERIGICILYAVFWGILLPSLGKWSESDGLVFFLSGMMSIYYYLRESGECGEQRKIMFESGKSMMAMPNARALLTKGIVMTRLTMVVIMMPITVLGRRLCIVFGTCEKVPTADILLLYGIAYCMAILAAGIPFVRKLISFIKFLCIIFLAGLCVRSAKMIAVLEKAYAYDMPWWLVAILVIVLFVGGTFLGMKLLERTYEKRRAEIPLDQRVAQQ